MSFEARYDAVLQRFRARWTGPLCPPRDMEAEIARIERAAMARWVAANRVSDSARAERGTLRP